MNKKVLLAALAAAVVGFLAGWVIYGMSGLMDVLSKHSMQYEGLMKSEADMKIEYYALANICGGILFAYIFGVIGNINSLMKGVIAGAIIWGLVGGGFNFSMAGGMNLMDKTGAMIDTAAGAVIGALMGGAAGFVLGMGNKES